MNEILWFAVIGWILGRSMHRMANGVLGLGGKVVSTPTRLWASSLLLAVSFAGVVWTTLNPWDKVIGCLLFLVLGVAVWTDLSFKVIPNRLTIPAGVHFLGLSIIKGEGWASLMSALVCGGFLLLIALLSKGGVGGGDIKLATAAGAALGFPSALAGLFSSLFLGGLAAAIFLLIGRVGKGFALPFAPFILGGFGSSFFVGEMLVQGYLSFFD
ncbi:prepilin peptidase [Marininema halotolerans]|uniref:Leader peptidase (Prepilin peptidase) / N-methyltransferase/leader peptidase (Prepilin peptidase) / N-methyltransferase n=1 Tax=Marininema halotolerans TaxID=1155944 RepID=A0A1I6U315_9BACL|nr:prepilin peptidase [Marininema halotolerans]SFS95866.1 leader peptidase (prepilin peptidase) / N-methyltransferase/leader peptidase (prepilin peptidase) / N-methyltransferase [Marininema halotolerans]